MSDDEVFVLLVSGFLASLCWIAWLVICTTGRRARAPSSYRTIAAVTPLVCAALLLVVLQSLASFDVRDSAIYLTFYTVLGAAWVGVGAWFFPMLGISLRDDVLERRNVSALWAICGALVGLTLCYAGANIGDGPGWWVVVICASLSTFTWFCSWYFYQSLTHVADHITIDRDPSAALRLAGFLVAGGLVLGRAVAGDWISFDETLIDYFKYGWPIVPLLVAAIVMERICRPTPHAPLASPILCGFVPALMYSFAAMVWVAYLGFGN